jgi:hypothetical protein
MAGVFISYRREDTPAHAGRVYERLAARYGKRRVFRDLDAIPFAWDFRQKINEAIGSSDALIVLIGRDWLTASDPSGGPKLHNPKDWLRVEIATALAKEKLVIPVLVENADMPSEDDLPDPLKPLAYRHALKTTEQDWDYHVGVLIRTIEENTDLRPGDYLTWAAYALMIAGVAARIIGGLRPIDRDAWFVSADIALIALLAVLLALLARSPRLRSVAAGMVVASGIGALLRFGQSLMGSGLELGQPLMGRDIDGTLVLYYIGLGSGLLLAFGGALLYLATPREGTQPTVGQTASAALLGFLGGAALVVAIVAESDRLFTIRLTAWPAVVPVGLAVVTFVGLILLLATRGFRTLGMGLLIVFGLQTVLRFVTDVGKPNVGAGVWIGVAGGAVILAAGLLGSLQFGRSQHAA